jgi:S1-C subfamily serine protease
MRLVGVVLSCAAMVALAGCGGSEENATPPRPTISSIVEAVSPSVVSITAGDTVGTGIVWSGDGVIVTARHVIEASNGSIAVELPGGRTLQARLVGEDPSSDLAVLRVAAEGLRAATFARRLPREGEIAVVVGRPPDVGRRSAGGTVRGVNRTAFEERGFEGLIETSARVRDGDSGGPIATERGVVIGLTTSTDLAAALGKERDVAFGVPATTIRSVVPHLLTKRVEPVYLGVDVRDLTDETRQQYDVEESRGVFVRFVQPDSPADVAGLVFRDVVTSVGGRETATLAALDAALRRHKPDQRVRLTVRRGGETRQLWVLLGRRPREE